MIDHSHIAARIKDGDQIHNASKFFSGVPDLLGDSAIALDDEGTDGRVQVAGLLTENGKTWTGYVFRTTAFVPPPSESADGEMRDAPANSHGAATADPEPEAEANDTEAPQPVGEGQAGGEPDPLLQLIHSIAGGRDEVVLSELGEALGEKLEASVQDIKDQIFERLDKVVEDGLTVTQVIAVKDLPPVTLPEGEIMHKDLTLVLALVRSGAKNVMLVGPAGCGKTTLARQVATALGHGRFAALSCSPGMSEAKVLGRLGVPTEKNETGYHETAVMAAFRHGGTILFDEMDNADASMMVSFNAMTDGGFATLPTGETVPRHPDTVIIAACNTFGHGADRMYVGRNQLDAATLDRFVGATVEMDYDRDLEKKLVPEAEVRGAVWAMRDKARKAGLRRVVSTRAIIAARRRHLAMSEPLPAVMKHITLGWSQQDRAAVGIS